MNGISMGKALLPDAGNHALSLLDWLQDITGKSHRPLLKLNLVSIEQGWGAVFFSLSAVKGRKAINAGRAFSHDMTTAGTLGTAIDSG